MRLHDSSRSTQDLDLGVSATDIDEANPGSLTLIKRPASLTDAASRDVPHREIEVAEVRYASERHLFQLKEARRDKSAADRADIAYLRSRLGLDPS